MPTYVYRREDGTKFEIKQRITEDPLEECPETGQPVERIIAGSAGLIFKGDGFYVNDYADSKSKKNGATDSAGAEASANGESDTKSASTSNADASSSDTSSSATSDSSSDS